MATHLSAHPSPAAFYRRLTFLPLNLTVAGVSLPGVQKLDSRVTTASWRFKSASPEMKAATPQLHTYAQ